MDNDFITIYLDDLNYVANKKINIAINIIASILELILLIINSINYKDYINNSSEYDVGISSFVLIGICHDVYSIALVYFIYQSFKRQFPLWIFIFTTILLIIKFIIQFKYMGLIEDINDIDTLYIINLIFYILYYVVLFSHIFIYIYILLNFSKSY